MKKWTQPEILDLKITLTAGSFNGLIPNAKTDFGKPSKKSDAGHTPIPEVSFTPVPSVGPSAILDNM